MNPITIVVVLALLGVGVWLLYNSRQDIRLGYASYRWPMVEGTVVDSRDDSFTIDGLDRTGAGIVPVEYKETVHDFVYQVAGRHYQCNTYCFGGGWAERAGAAYLIGTKVRVYYDPERPDIAVFETRDSVRRGVWCCADRHGCPLALARATVNLESANKSSQPMPGGRLGSNRSHLARHGWTHR